VCLLTVTIRNSFIGVLQRVPPYRHDSQLFHRCVAACATAANDARAFEVWAAAEAGGCTMDTVLLNTLLNVFARTRQADNAQVTTP
jgi:hypothetical protein